MKKVGVILLLLLVYSCFIVKHKNTDMKIKGVVTFSKYDVKIPSTLRFFQQNKLINKVTTDSNGRYESTLSLNMNDSLLIVIEPINGKIAKDTIVQDVYSVIAGCIDVVDTLNIPVTEILDNPIKNIKLNNCILIEKTEIKHGWQH